MVKEKFMFVIISKKKYNAIMSRLGKVEDALKQHSEQQKTSIHNMNQKLAEVDEKASKRYVSDNFSKEKDKPKSWNELMDEYLNGENKDDKGGN